MDKRRKELALVAVGALVVLVALFLTFRPRTQPAAAQPPATAAAKAAPGGEKPQPQVAKREDAKPVVIESGAATSAGRDPFRPIVVAKANFVPGPMASSATPPATTGLPPLPVFVGQAPPGGPVGAVPAVEPLRLAGVVQGNPSVAVLRKGNQRFIVTIGDPVDSQYTVKSISDGRVVLAKGEKTLSLTLGGRM